MAETLVSAVLGPVFEKLTDEAFKKFARSQNIHSELNDLQSKLTHIEAVHNDASRREVNEESVKLWLNNLQHLAYDIDDILDDVATEAMRRELARESGEFTSKVRNLIPTCCTKLSLTQTLHRKLDTVASRLQDLEKEKSDLGLVIGKDEKQKSNNRGNETCLLEPDIVGREGEKENLINKLLGGESSKENFSILPIVGMGGVGKTTLARLLYNDTRVKNHFELQAWVCVSDFDIVKISNAILGFDQLLKKLGFDHLDRVESLSDRDALSVLALHALGVNNFDSHSKLRSQGYLLNQSRTNNKAPEDLGHEYFEKLLSRSFFQYAPNDKSFYVMHDLMNDLATFVAGDMFLRFEQQTEMVVVEKALAKYRHMSFVREEYVSYQKFEAFESAGSLRTLLAVPFGEEQSWNAFYLSNKFLVNLIPQLPLLRVLSLRRFHIREVPDHIGKLKHLRYLNLSQTHIEELPENIGSLYNLQTLILFGCESLTKLPKSFVNLKKLRHFDIRDTKSLKKLPVGIGELRSLRTLTKIIIGGDEEGFAITELKGLSNLRGEISIEGLHNVQSATHAREANSSLRRLTKLGLNWSNGSRGGTLEKEVFNELKPHADMLNELKVEFYEGIGFPVWVGDPCFQKMVSVSIRDCRKCKILPPLGQLPFLKKLFIEGMDDVKVIGSEFTGTSNGVAFHSLEILSFENMSGWEEWSTNTEVLEAVFPCLGELSIKKCPKLKEVSLNALPSLRGLDIDECGNGILRSLVRSASTITKLKISRISKLTDEAWRGVLTYLGAVEEVDIRYCDNLLNLGEKEDDEDSNLLLSSLRVLKVSECKSMESCILNSNNSIERLWISDCESLTRVSFIGQKLKSLYIDRCKKLIMENMINTSMPMLEDVYISDWTDMKSQLIQLFSNSIHLTWIDIYDCPNCQSIDVASYPGGNWPPNLVYLLIGGLKKPISEWGSQNFPTSLVVLILRNEPHVRNFSQLSRLLPSSLEKLAICGFDKLESLSVGLQHLTSLQRLWISECPKLKDLPEALLPSLFELTIIGCPILTRRKFEIYSKKQVMLKLTANNRDTYSRDG
ncbi:hypothetical protein E3N88_07889 [Mikania micrantha]|uniref:Rx N-terminal domain-containing protein n=1 Tax=Mikania micrantha TaxID=192012 RepID=A0A5N6PET6_9ASTR|nr:hypothetical protein E3N88_07889 [Mikania micrantha]